jgi:hypothetical protein
MGVRIVPNKERETVSQYKERIVLERLKENLGELEALLQRIGAAKEKVEHAIIILERRRRNGK